LLDSLVTDSNASNTSIIGTPASSKNVRDQPGEKWPTSRRSSASTEFSAEFYE
jgi:hypothetical protein